MDQHRCCHEAVYLERSWRAAEHLAVEVRNLSPDSLARLEQRFHRGGNCWPSLDQLRGAHGKDVQLRPIDDEPEEYLRSPRIWFSRSRLILTSENSADKQSL